MADQIVETQQATTTSPTGAVRNTVASSNARVGGATLAGRVVNLITGILLTLLAIRFFLSLLGANRSNGFADFIYSLTFPFVAPFFGLFGYTMQYGVARFELETLVAMAVYALLGFALAKIVTLSQRHPAV
jgi:uncharacterized protein YggT (Ycf19 family)